MEYAVNPHLRLKVQREASLVTALSLIAPVPGRGLQRTELRRGEHGEEMDALVSVLAQLRQPALLRALPPETSGALLELGVLMPSGALPERPRFECVLPLAPRGAPARELLRRRAHELVRRQPPAGAALGASNEASELPLAPPTRWVKYEPSGIWLPYALPPDACSALDRALDEQALLAELGTDLAAAVLEVSGAEHALTAAVADSRAAFQAREHCSLAGLLPEAWRCAFASYYARLVEQGFWGYDDGQSARYWTYNEPVARLLHAQLAPLFASVAGVELVPSYAYSCWYVEGAQLEVHTDRPQCGYTVSLLVDTRATSDDVQQWPLGIVNPTTREVTRYVQAKGEAVLFCGTRYPHFRAAQPPGRVSACAFLHYVTPDFAGPLG